MFWTVERNLNPGKKNMLKWGELVNFTQTQNLLAGSSATHLVNL